MAIFVAILINVAFLSLSNAQGAFDKSFDLSDDVKQYVLGLHNDFRSQVATGAISGQPSAANMQKMEWDESIAKFAQEHANTCSMGHRAENNRDLEPFGTTGENIAMGGIFEGMASDDDLKKQFQQSVGPTNNEDPMWWGWSDEYRSFNFASNGCDATCGHYTQVAWAGSNKLGCGIAQCSGVADQFMTDLGYFVVCNYIPAGNMNNGIPYEEGQQCSACPAEANSCSDNGLCTA